MIVQKGKRIRRAVVAFEYLLVASVVAAGAGAGLRAISDQYVAESHQFAQEMGQLHRGYQQQGQPMQQPMAGYAPQAYYQGAPAYQAAPAFSGYPGAPPYQGMPGHPTYQQPYMDDYDMRRIRVP
jgi:hypothetical protein